jgi:hypothetical protein
MGRDIHYDSDRLPALAGLAKSHAMLCQEHLGWKDHYIAGLWDRDLPLGLLCKSYGVRSRRPTEWRAPSWS